jgi:putative hydrolase of the HAD superfamily
VVEGAAEALAALSERYRMAVISDAIFSPGWALKKLLEVHGLARYFDAFVFSDEIGVSKPHPKVFEKAAQSLGVATDRLCHIGDREHNDVDGAHRVSAKAVLFTGAKDRGSSTSRAEAVCGDLRELVDILEGVD